MSNSEYSELAPVDGTEHILHFSHTEKYPIISYGLPFPEACAKHINPTFGCSKVYVLISGSLSRNTDALARLEKALPDGMIVGVRKGMQPHTLFSETLETAIAIKQAGADCIITLGGGSLIDAAKIMIFAIANDVLTLETLEPLMVRSMAIFKASRQSPQNWQAELKPTTIKVICVTTTLSAGEYNMPIGGGTNDETHLKQLCHDFSHGGSGMIVWDPELTKTTPLRVWLSTGLRAIDHCVEQYCTLPSPPPQAAKISQDGLRILVSSLLYTKHHPEDLPARMRSQLGGMKSMLPYSRFNIKVGGSHGIGHQLGPHGIPHGETSALTMPSIAKYNAKVNGPQQADILAIFWDDKTVAEVLTKRGLEKDKNDLGDALDAIVRELDLPRTLKEFGVGRDKLQAIADNSVKDHCCTDNPIPLTEPSQIMEILETFLGE